MVTSPIRPSGILNALAASKPIGILTPMRKKTAQVIPQAALNAILAELVSSRPLAFDFETVYMYGGTNSTITVAEGTTYITYGQDEQGRTKPLRVPKTFIAASLHRVLNQGLNPPFPKRNGER